MKSIIVATLLVFAPFVAFAGGHSNLSASGTGVRIDLKTIEVLLVTMSRQRPAIYGCMKIRQKVFPKQ